VDYLTSVVDTRVDDRPFHALYGLSMHISSKYAENCANAHWKKLKIDCANVS